MEPPAGNMPGVKEAAKTYLAVKQIPQLFQVADNLMIDLRELIIYLRSRPI